MKNIFLLYILAVSCNAYCFTNNNEYPPPDFKRMMYDFCDACGCSANGGGMGFSSMIDQNFAGARYFNQSYSSRDGIFKNSPWANENFNTIQAWARIPVAKKVQLTALVPYHFHTREPQTGSQSIEGLGDITVIGMYTLYQMVSDSTAFTHHVQAGGGVKAPTGTYDSANNGSVNPSFQVGTGSWDYLITTEYVLRYKDAGLNTMLNYTFKTENNKEYQFGNQFNYGATMFYVFDNDDFTIVPQAGIAGEIYAANKQYGEYLNDTSGDILLGRLGAEAGFGRLSVGLTGMLPINQNLTGGRVEANYRWAVNVNYSL